MMMVMMMMMMNLLKRLKFDWNSENVISFLVQRQK